MEVHIFTGPIKYQIRDGSFWQKPISIFRTSAFLGRSVQTNREQDLFSFNERSNNFSQFFCRVEKLKKIYQRIVSNLEFVNSIRSCPGHEARSSLSSLLAAAKEASPAQPNRRNSTRDAQNRNVQAPKNQNDQF